MTKLAMSSKIPVTADQLWDTIKGFNDLPKWVPGVATSEVDGEAVGSRRTVTLADGTKLVEQLVEHDDGRRTYTYEVLESPLPLAGYRSSITVKDGKDGSDNAEVEWSSEFESQGAPDDEVRKLIEDFYQSGFDNLKKMFGG